MNASRNNAPKHDEAADIRQAPEGINNRTEVITGQPHRHLTIAVAILVSFKTSHRVKTHVSMLQQCLYP